MKTSHGPWACDVDPLALVVVLLVEPAALLLRELRLLDGALLLVPPFEALAVSVTVPAVVGPVVCGDRVRMLPPPEVQYE